MLSVYYSVIHSRILPSPYSQLIFSKKREIITASSSCPHPDIKKTPIRRSFFITTDATLLLPLPFHLLNSNSQTYCIYRPKTTAHMIPR